MSDSITRDKAYLFAVRIVKLCKILSERKEYILSKQLIRSGTAVGALLKEAEHAQSMPDFISKINIALKEANESEYWICLLKDTGYITEEEFDSISSDCKELIRLTSSIVKTSKNKL